MRGAMVQAFMMGLTSERIVLFVNNAPKGNKYLKSPWLLASCPNRRDYQCFFMPPSPCTPTVEEIANAHMLNNSEVRQLFKKGTPVDVEDEEKVWTFASRFNPDDFLNDRAVKKLQEYSRILVNAVPATVENANFIALLNKAIEAIAIVDKKRKRKYNYMARWSRIFHGLTIYSMRPNPSSAAALDRIAVEIEPDNFDSDASLGLPIRGT